MVKKMYLHFYIVFMLSSVALRAQLFNPKDYCLVWSDEFNVDGAPNTSYWNYEEGCSVRNNEAQYYTRNRRENARVEGGKLILEARREKWGDCDYTSASLTTSGKVVYKYGRFEMRAKIDARQGSWPAFWTLGQSGEWPSNGEIDIMEFYNSRIHANFAWGTETRWSAHWDSQSRLVSELGANWAKDFHVWRMEWTPDYISLYVDDILMNTVNVSQTLNGSISNVKNPFQQGHYVVINQAIGGNNGGDPASTSFPVRYEIDYVRIYQKGACHLDCNWIENGTAKLDDCLRCTGGATGLEPCKLTCNGNMLTNPGFEAGNLNEWTGWGTRAISSTFYAGKYGVQIGDGALERVVAVLPNMKYLLKAKARKSGGGWYRLGVKEHGAAEAYTAKDNNTWQPVELEFVTGNATSARIYLYNPEAGTVYGDDFELQPAGCMVTGDLEYNEPEDFVVYPNPSSSLFNVWHLGGGKMSVLDLFGKEVFSCESTEMIQFGDALEPGTYVLKLNSDGKNRIVRLVKN